MKTTTKNMINSSNKHIHNTKISSLQANSRLLRKDKKNDNHIATKQRLVDLISYDLYKLKDSCMSLTGSFLSEVQ
jgi:hypothetical protein